MFRCSNRLEKRVSDRKNKQRNKDGDSLNLLLFASSRSPGEEAHKQVRDSTLSPLLTQSLIGWPRTGMQQQEPHEACEWTGWQTYSSPSSQMPVVSSYLVQ